MSRECRRVRMDWAHPMDWDRHGPMKGVHFKPLLLAEMADAAGDGYQMYETCTEGTPISPVCATAEECARYCAEHEVSAFGDMTASYEWWLGVIQESNCGLLSVGPGGMKVV